jgi:hypothetical protein
MSNELQPEIYPIQFLRRHNLLIENNLQFAHLIDKADKTK